MARPTSELLASKAAEALQGTVSWRADESFVPKLTTVLDLLRIRPQFFLHVGRNRDNTVSITKGIGELGGGIWPLVLNPDDEIAPVGLRIKNMSGRVMTASGATEPKLLGVRPIKERPHIISLGKNVITDEEPTAPELDQALENLDWLRSPRENVLALGQGMDWIKFGITYGTRSRPQIGRLIFEHFTDEERELRIAALRPAAV